MRVKIEEVIGQRITEVRDAAGTSQAAFGAQLEAVLGRPWSRQSVSAAEKGRRAFTAAELVAIAYTLEVPIAELLTPPLEVNELELPSGRTVPYRVEAHPALPAQVLEALRRLEETNARRDAIEREERDLISRLVNRLAYDSDLNEAERAAITDAIGDTPNDATEDSA